MPSTIGSESTKKPSLSPATVILAQLFFGLFLIATGGWVSAEPSFELDRDPRGLVNLRYSFNVYGRFPTIQVRLQDLINCEVSESVSMVTNPNRVSASPRSKSVSSHNLVCSARDGSSFAGGNAFRAADINRFIDSGRGDTYEERIKASPLRHHAGVATGLLGGLLLVGACTNLFSLALKGLR